MTPRGPDPTPTVLLVDDEARSIESMRRTLAEEFRVLGAGSAAEARLLLDSDQSIDLILCDQRMPGCTGIEFLKEARERWPEVVRIVVSGYTDSEDIIAGVNDAGIFQYVLKPWVPDHLLQTARSAIEARASRRGLERIDLEMRSGAKVLRSRFAGRLDAAREAFGFERLARTPGSPLDAVCDVAARVARYDLAVLVLGESGTGKELLARGIHYASPRAAAPFVVENCAAVPETLLESELFGHKRGAFTGAHEDHVGLFQRAHGGTVFLDEIGDTTPAFQVKLLRVLQEGEVRPVGSPRPVPVDVRVLAATHRRLDAEVAAGRFREDLYYRLAGVTLTMPPLRERIGDIPAIARHLMSQICAKLPRPEPRIDDEAMQCLVAYPWPGNIRELQNELARAVALSDGACLHAADFSPKVLQGQAGVTLARDGGAMAALRLGGGTLAERLEAVEATILRETLLRLSWNRTRAAAELGLSRFGLSNKLKRLGLDGRKAKD
ncbi:MAG: sigma-54-dependent transcriptional regulator [Pseudomonadota bacterium]|jgi:two-component system response regulator HupR/HoxA